MFGDYGFVAAFSYVSCDDDTKLSFADFGPYGVFSSAKLQVQHVATSVCLARTK